MEEVRLSRQYILETVQLNGLRLAVNGGAPEQCTLQWGLTVLCSED